MTLLLGLTASVAAQDNKKANLDRIDGVIQMIDKDAKTITVRKGSMQRKVIFNDTTKFTTRNKKEGSATDLKENIRIISVGKFDDKGNLIAARIDFR